MTATDRTAQLQAFITNTVKGYASEKTMRRSMGLVLDAMKVDGLAGNFEIVTIANGEHAGRVVPVLAFGPREQVPSEACAYMHRGVVLFQYRA